MSFQVSDSNGSPVTNESIQQPVPAPAQSRVAELVKKFNDIAAQQDEVFVGRKSPVYSKDDLSSSSEDSPASMTRNLYRREIQKSSPGGRKSPPTRSKEDSDSPSWHDKLFNYIPGSCFETGVSLSLLQDPGPAGLIVDDYARKLSSVLHTVYKTDKGNAIVTFKGQERTVRSLFDEFVLKDLSPLSSSIGRHPDRDQINPDADDEEIAKIWMEDFGVEWTQEELETRVTDPTYQPSNMMTKLKALSGVGDMMQEVDEKNVAVLAEILDKEPQDLLRRAQMAKDKIRHETFSHPATRKRAERMPIINLGDDDEPKPLSAFPVKVEHADAKAKKLGGFGLVYHHRHSITAISDHPDHVEMAEKVGNRLQELVAKHGTGGIKRLGQAIDDMERPGILAEDSMENIPESFKEAGLEELMQSNRFHHATGVNRGQLLGSYAQGSWHHDLPAAGSHSGTTSDILSGCNVLDEEPIFGNKVVAKSIGILTAAYMNYGGYHTFVETFPIAAAVGKNQKFEVAVHGQRKESLYPKFLHAIDTYGGIEASEKAFLFYQAYQSSLRE